METNSLISILGINFFRQFQTHLLRCVQIIFLPRAPNMLLLFHSLEVYLFTLTLILPDVCHPIPVLFLLITNIDRFLLENWAHLHPQPPPSQAELSDGARDQVWPGSQSLGHGCVRDGRVVLLRLWQSGLSLLLESSENWSFFLFLIDLSLVKIKAGPTRGITGCRLYLKWRQPRRKSKQKKDDKFSPENITWDPHSLKGDWCLQWSKPGHIFFARVYLNWSFLSLANSKALVNIMLNWWNSTIS